MSLFIRVAAKCFRLAPEYKCQIVAVATFIEVKAKNSRCLIFRKKEIVEETHILNKKQERITVIDALRGFGLSFFIQMDRAQHKGLDFRGRFLWRMFILFVLKRSLSYAVSVISGTLRERIH